MIKASDEPLNNSLKFYQNSPEASPKSLSASSFGDVVKREVTKEMLLKSM